MDLTLHGKTAVVTGASSGIGAGVAQALAAEGAQVLLVGRDQDRLARTMTAVGSAGGRAAVHQQDLSEPGAPQAVVAAALALGGAVDVLVNAAGLFEVGSDDEVEALRRQWDVNVHAPFALARHVMTEMPSGGAMCFVSSIAGHVAFPGASAYCVTKSAVLGAVRALALDAAPYGVTVNAVSPGNVRTPMNAHLLADPGYERSMVEQTPLGRVGEVDDITPAVTFLVSDHARYITGTSLVVDGGWTAR